MPGAIVVGGGIAGCLTAVALRRLGWDVEVAEARPADADELGSFLTLQSNGLAAMRALGVLDVVLPLGFPTPVMDLWSASGRRLGSMPLGPPLDDGSPARTVRRGDLYRVLREAAVTAGARVTTGRRCTGVVETGARVVVTFADGSTAAADLVVGADGVRSAVRPAVSGRNPGARYLPLLNLGGFSAGVAPDLAAPPGRMQMMFGRRAFFGWATAPDGATWWFANVPRRVEPAPGELAAVPSAVWRAELAALLADDSGPAARIVAATPGDLGAWATYDLPRVPVWRGRRTVLVGDAVHAASPSSGQGAAMAAEDALALARCLRDVPDEALAVYEGLRRRRVERVVAAGRRTSSSKAAGPLGRAVRDAVMPHVLRRIGPDGGLGWVFAHRNDWEEPVAADAVPRR
ncbi:MAG: FAD-dependent monooxygenase [Actinobacteria bacterium]|nr:FAD-dependent monooxygenase [Actinomycetota bacterium]